ncbi:MAG: DUF87 domain-containing protein [Spirochaetota bacterium]
MNVPTSTDGPQESQAMASSQNVSIAETRKGTYQAKYEDEQIRRQEFSRKRTRGYVIECDGEHAIITAKVRFNDETAENYWAVGQLVSIRVGKNRVVGLTCRVDSTNGHWDAEGENDIRITLELVGEIVDCGGQGADRFSSGIASYPQMGCIAHRIRAADLEIIYKTDGDTVVKVGQLTQDQSVAAKIEIDKLLSRHFAVVGTTGVGKSTSVTLLLRKVIAVRPDIRVLMLDPHNEFATAFPNDSVVVDSTNLNLPYWLFKLDEFAEVVFRGQDGFDPEIELLRDILPLAKEQYRAEAENNGSSLVRKKVNRSNLTADMPVPYRLADLIKIIDDRLGQLEGPLFLSQLKKSLPPSFLPSPKTLAKIQNNKEIAAEIIFICGRYEGIDQRIIGEYVDLELSVGDYVLSSGELASLSLTDTIYRLCDGVISKESLVSESFSGHLLEYPQYTRPESFRGQRVPEILLSGHHEKIRRWRLEQSVRQTVERRPELLHRAREKNELNSEVLNILGEISPETQTKATQKEKT